MAGHRNCHLARGRSVFRGMLEPALLFLSDSAPGFEDPSSLTWSPPCAPDRLSSHEIFA